MELAHKYIDGLASDSEILQIKERLRTDAKFRKEFMRLQAMKAMLKADMHIEHMRADMGNLFDEVVLPKLDKTRQPAKVINLQRFALAVAAAAVSLLLVATFVFNFSESNNQLLYQAYYSPYISNTFRGEQNLVDATYQTAINQYSLGNYVAAEQQLDAYLQKNVGNTSSNSSSIKGIEHLYLLMGNCALNQGATDRAENYFKKILNSSNRQYIHDAKWYLGLTYLRDGNEEEAKKQFEDIVNVMNVYQVEAQKLLKKWEE